MLRIPEGRWTHGRRLRLNGDSIPARSVAVVGLASSTRPELTGIELALEKSLPGEDLSILMDLLVAMSTLFSLRRADFPLSLHRNACRQLLRSHTW